MKQRLIGDTGYYSPTSPSKVIMLNELTKNRLISRENPEVFKMQLQSLKAHNAKRKTADTWTRTKWTQQARYRMRTHITHTVGTAKHRPGGRIF